MIVNTGLFYIMDQGVSTEKIYIIKQLSGHMKDE